MENVKRLDWFELFMKLNFDISVLIDIETDTSTHFDQNSEQIEHKKESS